MLKTDSSHPNHIVVADAQLLFTADFHRAGPDLILTGHDGRHHVIPGYFSTEQRPALAAPNGASLSADLVALLAGSPTPNQYAQATPAAAPASIGQVEKIVGTVTVLRNGVEIALNVGDKVYKSDVIQTAADSQAGISFPDGTALNLVANTRMALNDFTFDDNATSGNSALVSLVEGSFSFVAGKVAHTGDMKLDTPVATMGIRGTTGWVAEITANVGNESYTFAVVPDYGTNQSGSYDLIGRDGNVIATVSQPGFVTSITPQGTGIAPLVTVTQATPQQTNFEQIIVQQVFQTLTAPTNPANPNNPNNPNPQSNPNSNGSSTGDLPQNSAPKAPPTPTTPPIIPIGVTPETGPTVTVPTADNLQPPQPVPLGSVFATQSGNWNNPNIWDDNGFIPTATTFVTINAGGPITITVDDQEAAAALFIGLDATLQIVSNPASANPDNTPTTSSLTVAGSVNDSGLIVVNSTVSDPTLNLSGPVTITASGEIEAIGSAAVIDFQGNLITNLGSIVSSNGATISFLPLTLTVANPNGSGTITEAIVSIVDNGGMIAATNGGKVVFSGAIVNNFVTVTTPGTPAANGTPAVPSTSVTTFGTIEATGAGADVQFVNSYLQGGTLATGNPVSNADGEIEIVATTGANISILDGSTDTVSINGFVQVDDGASLALLGTFDNSGTVAVGSSTGAQLVVDGTVTLNGSGTVALDAGGTVVIGAANTSATLINANTISGAGAIEQLVLENQSGGTVEASGGGTLTLDDIAVANAGTLAATGSGSVLSDFLGTLVSSGAVVAENQGAVDVFSVSVQNDPTGTMTATSGGSLSFELSALTNEGTLEAELGGTVSIDNTKMQNSGLIVAQTSGTVTLSNSNSLTFVNTGTIEAGGGGTVNFVDTTLSNDGGNSDIGVVSALNDGEIVLQNATILEGSVTVQSGGELATVSGSANLIDTADGQNDLNVVTLSNAGTLAVTDNSSLELVSPDTISNSGTIQLNSTGHETTLTFDQPFAGIDGGGQIVLTDNADNVLAVAASGQEFTNFDNTISGAGTIGAGGMVLVNSGTIDADQTVPLILVPISLTNTGTLEATAGGTLQIGNIIIGNSGGTISAAGAGSTIDLSAVTINGGTINDGTSAVGATIVIVTTSTISGAAINNGGITVDAQQTLTLDNDTVTGTAFTDTASGAVLSLDGGDTLTLDDVTVNGGALNVASGATLDLINTQLFGVSLSDFGTINVSGTSSINQFKVVGGQTVVLSGQTLVLDNVLLSGTVTDNGTLQVDSGDTSMFAVVTITGGVLDNAGQIIVSGNATLDSVTTSNTGGIITVSGGDTLSLAGSASISGGTVSIDNLGGLTLNGTDTISGGTLGNTGTLTAAGTDTLDNETVTNIGAIAVTDSLTLNGTTAVTNTGGSITVNGGDTLTLADTASISGGTVTIDSLGTLALDGTDTISGGALGNAGALTVAGSDTLSNETITNTGGAITVEGGDALTLADTASMSGGTVTIDSLGTLTLNDASISGSIITDNGLIDITGSSALNGTTSVGGGAITIESGETLTLNDATLSAVAVTDNGLIDVAGSSTFSGTTSVSGGQVTVESGQTLTLDDATLTGSTVADHDLIDVTGSSTFSGTTNVTDGQVTVESGQTLTLNDATLTGSAVADHDLIDVTGSSTLGGNTGVSGGAITIESGQILTLDDVTISGSAVTDSGLIDITGSSALNGTTSVSGGAITVESGETLTLNDATLSDSAVTDNGLIDVTGSSTLNDATSVGGGSITVESGETLMLGGATLSGSAVADHDLIDVTVSSTLDGATGVSGGAVTVESGETLTLDDATLTGSTITDDGLIDVTGSATLNGTTSVSGGAITVEAGVTLTLNDATLSGSAVNDDGLLDVIGSSTFDGNASISGGAVTVESGATLTLDGATLTAASGSTLTLDNDSTISVTADSAVDNTSLTNEASADSVTINSGSTLTLDDTTASGGQISGGGTLSVDTNDTLTLDGVTVGGGQIANAGSLEANGGTFTIDGGVTISGSGSVLITNGGTADFQGAFDQNVTFSGAGTLELAQPTSFNSSHTIGGLAVGDVIDLADDTSVISTVISGSTLTINESGGGPLTFQIAGALPGNYFAVQSDGHGGDEVVLSTGATPTLTAAINNLTVSEDGTLAFGVGKSSPNENDPVSIAVTGVPSDATLSSGIDNSGVWMLTPSELSGLTLTAGEVTTTTLTVTATDTVSGESSAPQTIDLTVNPVAPALTLAHNTLSVNEDGTVALGIGETPFDARDTVSVTITGIPGDATLTDANGDTLTVTGGSITLNPSELTGLTLNAGEVTTATLTVTATNTEGVTASSAPQTIDLTVNPVAPALTLAHNTLSVNEDGTVALGIGETPFDARDTVSVTITGIPGDATLTDANGDTLTVTGGSITLNPSELTGLTLNAGEVTTATLTVTATNTEGVTASSAPQTIDLTVNPVAPMVTIDAIDGNNIINKADAAAGVTVSGTAFDSGTGGVDGQTVTVDIVNSSNVVTDSLTGTVSGGDWSVDLTQAEAQALVDGTYTVTANVSDFAVNPATEATQTVTVDETTPTVGVAINHTDVNLANDPSTVTFTFSEAPTSFTLADTTAVDGTLSNLTGSGTSYSATFTGAANTDASNASVSVTAGSWSENNGNPGNGGSTGNFTVGTVTPTVNSVLTKPLEGAGNIGTGATITITLVLNEAVTFTGGNPSLTLSNGDTATYFSGSGTNSLLFRYTVGSTTNATPDLTVTGVNHAGITDGNGNAATLSLTTSQENLHLGIKESESGPAGVAGSPINLALTDPSGTGALTTVTFSGMPTDWSLNEGTNLGNGTWTVQTNELGALTVLTTAAYAGAMTLGVTETSVNADGSTASAVIADNVEAYAPGSPIFAWSGADTLTGAGANDLFVFAQPIGDDTIFNFNVATDKIDLTGFAGIAGFGDFKGNIVDDSGGNAVITLGAGETITLHGVDATSLTASDFVFNQTPALGMPGPWR